MCSHADYFIVGSNVYLCRSYDTLEPASQQRRICGVERYLVYGSVLCTEDGLRKCCVRCRAARKVCCLIVLLFVYLMSCLVRILVILLFVYLMCCLGLLLDHHTFRLSYVLL